MTLGGYVIPDSFSIVEIVRLSTALCRFYKLIWNTLDPAYREGLLLLVWLINSASRASALSSVDCGV